MSDSLMLLLAILWPLLLTGALPLARGRLPAARLLPLAPVPALLLGIAFEESTLNLPFAMLGGILKLDFTGRAFLLLAAAFSLAAGLLAQGRIKESGDGERITLFMLLAVSGAIGLALAGDALFFFAASTLLGYSLYGLVAPVSGVTCSPCRVFLALLVVSDLTIFELLLVLAHEAGETNFSELRHALLLAEYPGATLSLLLVGFGIKFGLLGFHLWLAPIFLIAPRHVRPLLVGFIFCAGLLGVLRLLPLGEVYWPGAGALMQWLAIFTLLYSVAAGAMQAHFRAAQAYGVMALGALFLWLLGGVLAHPALWSMLFGAAHAALIVPGIALAMLLLLPERRDGNSLLLRRAVMAAGWLAAVMLVAATLPLFAVLLPAEPAQAAGIGGFGAAFALLAGRSLRLQHTSPHTARSMTAAAGAGTLLLLAGFITAPVTWWLPALLLLLTAFVGWQVGDALTKRLPTIPPGDLLGPVVRASRALYRNLYHLADTRLPHLRKQAWHLLYRFGAALDWRRRLHRLEAKLSRWPAAMLMLVIVLLALTLPTSL
jgi:NADH:ubiquinone oxidoreductase subunit 2 (subunit N)